jgi:hypothetical protein
MNQSVFFKLLYPLVCVLALMVFSQSSWAQELKRVPNAKETPIVRKEIKRTEVTKQESYPQTISVQLGSPQVVHDSAYYVLEIKRLEDQIKAIDQKVLVVQSDPNSDTEAKKNGWYDQMNATKQQLVIQCETYKTYLK